jgi:hypothetical protein
MPAAGLSFADWKKQQKKEWKAGAAKPEAQKAEAGKTIVARKVVQPRPACSENFAVSSAAAKAPRKVMQPRAYVSAPEENGDAPAGTGTNTSLFSGVYDEKAAASSFQEALSEWRGGGKAEVMVVNESRPAPIRQRQQPARMSAQPQRQAMGGRLIAPRARPQAMPEEHEEGRVMYARPKEGPERPQRQQYQPPTGPAGLGDGMYDERTNAREFQSAVAEWRSGGSIKIVRD